jgi:signal transduction histidine kinase
VAAASGTSLEATLHDIVAAAVRHVDATYGALGVLTSDGDRIDSFVTAGMDDHDRERIGPQPPTQFHLEVAVRAGEAILGTLSLSDKRSGGPFTPGDAAIAEALASVAGMAIENARLVERAETGRKWDRAATEIATALMSGAEPDDVLRAVSGQVSALVDADMSGVLAPSVDDDDSMTIVAAVGHAADDYEGVRLPLNGTYLGALNRTGVPRRMEDISTMPVIGRRAAAVIELTATFGPGMIAPLGDAPGRGLLAVLRSFGREPFSAEQLGLLSGFAAQAAVVLDLARARQRDRSMQVQSDRDRIARDLHDHVVQRIFATALSLDRLGRSLEPGQADIAARLSRSVDELHGTIVRIRTTIFELHEAEDTSRAAVRGRLADVVGSVTDGHDLRPVLRIRCERENLPADLLLDLVAVVRELLTNVVRHARARRVTVSVAIADQVCVVVTDDGRGLPPVTVRSGLANLAARAERRNGTLACTSSDAGTEIQWRVPLPG